MPHVMTADHARAIGEAVGMAVARRAQQQRRRVDGARGDDDDVAKVVFGGPVAAHDHPRDLAPGRARLQALDVGAGQQRRVGMREGRIDAHRLRVGLGADEAGMPVAGRAADARALLRLALVEHDPERHVERPQPLAREVVGERLDPRLVAHDRMRVRRAGRWIRRVHAPLAVDLIETLGARVVRLEVLVGDRPRRRHAGGVLELAEVLAAHPEQGGAVELRVAPHPVVGVRMQVAARGVAPDLLRGVLALEVDRARGPVVLLARHVTAALEQQDALARRRQRVEEGAAAGARADDDEVVTVGRGHEPLLRRLSARDD